MKGNAFNYKGMDVQIRRHYEKSDGLKDITETSRWTNGVQGRVDVYREDENGVETRDSWSWERNGNDREGNPVSCWKLLNTERMPEGSTSEVA